MKMIWCGLKIKENCHALVIQLHGNFRSETLSGRKIRSVFRDVKWCFIVGTWGVKGQGLINERLIMSNNPANTRRSPNASTMMDQRRKRWANVVPTLGECFLFAGKPVQLLLVRQVVIMCYWGQHITVTNVDPMLIRCWTSVVNGGPASNTHWLLVVMKNTANTRRCHIA